MTNRASIIEREAFLWTPFGLDMAKRYFSEEKLAELPRFKRGKHVGEIKGRIEWRKVERGGWVSDGPATSYGASGHVELRVGKVIDVSLTTAEWGKPNATIASWHLPRVGEVA